jgi:hypothetical protein
MFFFRKLAVRSYHNSRPFMTKGAAQGLGMGPNVKTVCCRMPADAKQATGCTRYRIRKCLTGNPLRHRPDTIPY